MVILLPWIVSWNKESVIVMLALWSLGLDRNCRGQMSRVGSYGTYSTLSIVIGRLMLESDAIV
jgi:hypothetical protein